MNRYLIYVAALTAGLALFAAVAFGSENRRIWCAGNICIADDGGIFPSKLPKHGKAPVSARLNGEISTVDSTHPPAFEALDLEVDKTIAVDAVGLPACTIGRIQSSTSATAKRACASAIVGSGTAEVEVAFPEQTPFRSTGPVLLFNGGVKGATTTVLIHAYVNVPAPTAIVTKALVTRVHNGRFGLHLFAKVPRIAGGSGSLTDFDVQVGRRFTYKGERKSFLMAGCPTGTWLTRGNARFADGTQLNILHPFTCTPTG
jgi:hypothetical protein